MNHYLNNLLTAPIYFSVGFVFFSLTLLYFYKKYGRIYIDDIAMACLIGFLWVTSVPALIIWKVSNKLDEYFFF